MNKTMMNEIDSATAEQNQSFLPPSHMTREPWLEFEAHTAESVQSELKRALEKLSHKPNVRNVHESRVLLRRWNSIWKVLKEDGWQTKVQKLEIGDELKAIGKMLGLLRDYDVNIEVASSLGSPNQILSKWKYEREVLASHTKKRLKRLDTTLLMKHLKKFLRKRPDKLRAKFEQKGISDNASAYEHFEPFLLKQEELAKELAATAKEPDELHKLRLSIKAWRYLLVEFYGLTNLQLVRAQQILGKLNDLHRVSELLEEYEQELIEEPLSKLKEQQDKLLIELSDLKQNLPFGLRPRITATAVNSKET